LDTIRSANVRWTIFRGGCHQYDLAVGSTDLVFVIVRGFIDADLAEGADTLTFHEHHVALDETVGEDIGGCVKK